MTGPKNFGAPRLTRYEYKGYLCLRKIGLQKIHFFKKIVQGFKIAESSRKNISFLVVKIKENQGAALIFRLHISVDEKTFGKKTLLKKY